MNKTIQLIAVIILLLLISSTVSAFDHTITAVALTNPTSAGRYILNQQNPITVNFTNNGTANDTNVRVSVVIRNSDNAVIYRDTQVVNIFLAGQTKEVSFLAFTPRSLSSFEVCGIALLETDEDRSDDTTCATMHIAFEANAKAISVSDPSPDDSIPAKIGFRAKGTFSNIGVRDLYDMKARMQIRRCADNTLVIQIDSTIPELIYDDGVIPFEFPSRSASYDVRKLSPGCYTVALICMQPDDGDRTNDTAFANFTVYDTTLSHDVKAVSVLSPANGTSIANPTTIPISIRFQNTGTNDESVVKVVAWVSNPKGVILYRDTSTISFLLAGAVHEVAFKTFVFPSQGNYSGSYIFSGAILLANDEYRLDDTVSSSVTLGTLQDVESVEILDPYQDEIKPGGVGFAVKVTFRTRWGTGEVLNVPVRVLIRECRDNLLRFLADTVIPKLYVDSGLFTVTFPITSGPFSTSSLPAGCYEVRAFHRLSFDGNRSNDTAKGDFTIAPYRSHNMTASIVSAPADMSHGGKLIALAVKYQNTGVNDEAAVTLIALVKDRGGNEIYRDSAFESNWKTNEVRNVGFTNFTLPDDGIYTIHGICSMAGDVWRFDDTTISHYSTGQAIDAEAVAVVYPSDDSTFIEGTSFQPIGSFRWVGGYDDKYPVPVSFEIRRCDDMMLVFEADSILDSLRIEDEVKDVVFAAIDNGWDIANIPAGCYRVAAIANMEFDGNRDNDTAYVSVSIIPTKSSDAEAIGFLSVAAYPNPFTEHTTLAYTLPQDGYVTLRMINSAGSEVKRLLQNEYLEKGMHSTLVTPRAEASGSYFIELIFTTSQGIIERILHPVLIQR